MKPYSIFFILGTRPEAIKMAPVILEFQKSSEFNTKVISTGQHNEMVNSVINIFDLKIDIDLEIMKPNQSIEYLTNIIIQKLSKIFESSKPDLIFIQGDTTTAFSASLAAFYKKIPIGHIEAGLRTNNFYSPFPEELNRRLISQISNLNFAPTKQALKNLNDSNLIGENYITGNTVIDAMRIIIEKTKEKEFSKFKYLKNKVILATIHRRENWGINIKNFCTGIIKILEEYNEISVLLPMHPNNKVRHILKSFLGNHPKVLLSEPLNYEEFLFALKNCHFVITDSGGIQEEAPFLGKPVLIFRDTTERVESLELGCAKLIGTTSENLYQEVKKLLMSKSNFKKMSKYKEVYGDGYASQRILKTCKLYFDKK